METYPKLVSWLRMELESYPDDLPGEKGSCLMVSLQLTDHIHAWINSFRLRIAVHDQHALAAANPESALVYNHHRDAANLRHICEQLESYFRELTQALGRNPSVHFQFLFRANPLGTAALLEHIARAWHKLPPARKFGLIGGYDAVDAICKNKPKHEQYADYVAVFMQAISPSEKWYPSRITKGATSAKEVRLARAAMRRLPEPTTFDLMVSSPAINSAVGGLNTTRRILGIP